MQTAQVKITGPDTFIVEIANQIHAVYHSRAGMGMICSCGVDFCIHGRVATRFIAHRIDSGSTWCSATLQSDDEFITAREACVADVVEVPEVEPEPAEVQAHQRRCHCPVPEIRAFFTVAEKKGLWSKGLPKKERQAREESMRAALAHLFGVPAVRESRKHLQRWQWARATQLMEQGTFSF